MQLHKLLDFKELREFATLLKVYREELKVNDFLEKLKDLYGEQRQFLIPGTTHYNIATNLRIPSILFLYVFSYFWFWVFRR